MAWAKIRLRFKRRPPRSAQKAIHPQWMIEVVKHFRSDEPNPARLAEVERAADEAAT